jgi:hypothetical protein
VITAFRWYLKVAGDCRNLFRLLSLVASVFLGGWAQASDESISFAEATVFSAPHLAAVAPNSTLTYRFTRVSPPDAADSDVVRIHLAAGEGGVTMAQVEFLRGPQAISLPPIESPISNPIVLAFLERDIRDMQRMTGGQANYFRKRIRLALAEHADSEAIEIQYHGVRSPALRISITPYETDVRRDRYGKYAAKRYAFVFCTAVPGEVAEIQTEVRDPETGDLLVRETLRLEDAE